jgi:hypothetical protein
VKGRRRSRVQRAAPGQLPPQTETLPVDPPDRTPPKSTTETTPPAETRQWDPLPAIGKSLGRFAAGKLAGFLASLFLLPIVVAASRATNGSIHLVLGLCVFSVFMALAQSAGALFASRGKSAVTPLALTFKYWFVLPLLALWPLLSAAGIADGDKQPMLTGVAIGLAVILTLWLGWAVIARRQPSLKYHPGRLKGLRWYVRLTMNAGGLIGGLAAIGLVNR